MSMTNILLRESYAERSDGVIVDLGQDMAIRVPGSGNIVAHLVLDGQIVIDAGKDSSPTVIRRGEFALLMYGTEHTIRTSVESTVTSTHTIDKWPDGEEPPVLKVGGSPQAAQCISAALRAVYHPVTVQRLHPFPELLHLTNDPDNSEVGTVLLANTLEIEKACHGPGGSAFVNALMNLYLFQALRHATAQMGKTMPRIAPTDIYLSSVYRPVASALRVLRTHPERHWSLAELASELGLSRSSLAKHFSASVGIGPMEYLTNIRMEKAATLLRAGNDMPLCVIGRRVGYGSASSFVRAFKAHYGVPPKKYGQHLSRHEESDQATAGASITGTSCA